MKEELKKVKAEQTQSDEILEMLEKELQGDNLPADKKEELRKIVTQLAIKNIKAHKLMTEMEIITNKTNNNN